MKRPLNPGWIELPLEADVDVLLKNLSTAGTLRFSVQAENAAGNSSQGELAEMAQS